jgi:hypothetical protein
VRGGGEVSALSENREVWQLVVLAGMPWKVGFGGAYALDRTLLRGMSDDLGIERHERFYERLNIIEAEVLRLLKDKNQTEKESKICSAKDKEHCTEQHEDWLAWACSQCEKNPERGKPGKPAEEEAPDGTAK